jgi:choice-of-anchor A domain-containing protein
MLSFVLGRKPESECVATKPRSTSLSLECFEEKIVPAVTDLGIATTYNAFTFGNFQGNYSDIEGRIAVGGSATLNNYSIGTKLPPTNRGSTSNTVVQGNISWQNGTLNNQNLLYGGTASLRSVNIVNGAVARRANVINFPAVQNELTTKSDTWAGYYQTGSAQIQGSTVTLRGTRSDINVFALNAFQLQNMKTLNIQVPTGSSVLVNVEGTNVSLANFGMNLNGLSPTKVLFNLPNAQNLNIYGVGFKGSILAPRANVQFNNAHIDGTLVAKCISGTGQFHHFTPTFSIFNPPIQPSTLGGSVVRFGESNNAANIPINLERIDRPGFSVTVFTLANGAYSIENILPGTYRLSVDASALVGYSLQSTIGTLGGMFGPGNSYIDIVIPEGVVASGYNFVLRPA